jgi:hemoglobin
MKRLVQAFGVAFRAAIAVMAVVLAACAGAPPVPPAPAPERSLYERVGGREAIAAVVEDATGNISTDTRINRRFGAADITTLNRHLVDLLCVRLGGPCTYTGANMADAHEGMFIRADEFDALIEDLEKSLDKLHVPPREKGEVLAILRQMKGSVIDH